MLNVNYRQIVESRKIPEANIQAEFYMLCRKYKIQILLEVKYQDCRFDAVVFTDDRPFAIIEFKNRWRWDNLKPINEDTRQMKKYRRYGLPIIQVLSARQIIKSFNQLLQMIDAKGDVKNTLNNEQG